MRAGSLLARTGGKVRRLPSELQFGAMCAVFRVSWQQHFKAHRHIVSPLLSRGVKPLKESKTELGSTC
jgi:hypothetical protein